MNPYFQCALVATVLASVGLLATPLALAEEGLDACRLLRQADVEAAFAPRKFGAGTPAKTTIKKSPTMAAVSQCTYTSAGATAKDRVTVSLLARRAPSDAAGVTPQAARAGAVQLKATPVDVPGLGEGAYTINMGSAAFPVIELNIFRGKRDWLVFGSAGMKLDTKAALVGLTKLAAATQARQ